MDDRLTDLVELQLRIESTDLIPSQRVLLGGLGDKMESLRRAGIQSLADLRVRLKNKGKRENFAKDSGIDADYLKVLHGFVEGLFPVTQRAYTLKIKGLDEEDWREALWKSHWLINRGARVFGNFLLTLRGGLSHELVENAEHIQKLKKLAKEGAGKKREKAQMNLQNAQRDARIMLTLGWLSVEAGFAASGKGPFEKGDGKENWKVAEAKDPDRSTKVGLTLRTILQQRGVKGKAATDWVCEVEPTLQSAIRTDAVWVNRSAAFDELCKEVSGLDRKEAAKAIFLLFGEAEWLKVAEKSGEKKFRKKARDFGEKARHFVSDNFGKRTGEDIEKAQKKVAEGKRLRVAKAVQNLLEERLNLKLTNKHLGAAQADTISPMLEHAARRVSIAHSWAMRAEISRRKFEETITKQEEIPKAICQYLDRYCQQRSEESGSLDGYRINPKKALSGWKEVVTSWRNCKNAQERVEAVREVQRDFEKKFGDVNLFMQLAEDDAQEVWKKDSRFLEDYAKARQAESDRIRFKVPAYRHPDPFFHPAFAELGKSRWDIRYMALKRRGEGKKPSGVKKNDLDKWDFRDMQMCLWDGIDMKRFKFRWQSKRLWADLGLGEETVDEGMPVARLDRLGRSIAGNATPQIREIWKKELWNGRLQAQRRNLEHLGSYVRKKGWDSKAKTLRRRIDWILTFSADLECGHGPWLDYTDKNNVSISKNDIGYYPKVNKGRKRWLIRHDLCHLPGLRVLSVDLGHRAAASCAVWEALSSKDFEAECRQRGVVKPNSTDLYRAHPSGKGQTIYRRIAADDSPAPWARLDRQFAIRLQGEGKRARKPREDEKEKLEELRNFVGHTKVFDREDTLRVDEYHREAVRLLRWGLRRHKECARIAYYLAGKAKPQPGGGEKKLSRGEAATEALFHWHNLLAQQDWQDDAMEKLWENHVKQEVLETTSSRGKKKREEKEALRNGLKPVAEWLANEVSILDGLTEEIRNRWKSDDEEWKKQLRIIADWLMPRGLRILKEDDLATHKKKRAAQKNARDTGGLSMTRISTLRGMWRVQKSFITRSEPDDLRKNVPDRDDGRLENFGQKSLDRFEHLREQRVKQISSRIIEAALGLGAEPGNRQSSRRMRTLSNDARFAPCHAIVIENLEHYRPDDLHTRRENRQLMEWSSGKLRDYLGQGCELYGLLLKQVNPMYTSKQDSRTGAPGLRCDDISIHKFLDAWWQERISKANNKKEAKRSPYDRYLLKCQKTVEQWEKESKGKRQDCLWLRIPQRGGQIFVSADEHSPIAGGLQADLNAACNIGLRALTDPDWPGKWWWVPCDSKNGAVDKELAVKDGLLNKEDVLLDINQKGKGEKTNVWHDVTGGELNKNMNHWRSTTKYWDGIEERVCEILRKRLKTP